MNEKFLINTILSTNFKVLCNYDYSFNAKRKNMCKLFDTKTVIYKYF